VTNLVLELMRLQAMLSSLPLFPFMAINVTALARHPSAIDARKAAGR